MGPAKEFFTMSKARHDRQREKRKLSRREEKLNAKTEFGISDPAPREAVDFIMHGAVKLVNTYHVS